MTELDAEVLVEPDPWPKLTLVVSLEAIFLSAFVLIGRNRQAAFQVAKADHDFFDSQLRVFAGIGVAVSAGADLPATLIDAADSDMYQAKRDHPTRLRAGHRSAAALLAAEVPKHERLTRRLLEVLSTVEVEEEPKVSA